jgi:hypothetical protein
MPVETMISGDWWKVVKAAATPKHVEWSAQDVEVSIGFPDHLCKKLEKDPLLLPKLSDGGSTACKASVSDRVGQAAGAEAPIGKHASAPEADRDAGNFSLEPGRVRQGLAALMTNSADKAPAQIA